MLNFHSTQPQQLQRALGTPGGFAWWYLDLVDEAGDGLVLIWFFGLPLLPHARRHDLPATRPGLCLSVYRGGRSVLYLLQEHTEADAQHGRGRFDFGRTTIDIASHGQQLTVTAELDEAVPGTSNRLTGRVVASGPRCQTGSSQGPSGPHQWSPILTASEGYADLRIGAETISMAGRCYVDSNVSETPLDQLGIQSWSWGRIALPQRELIYYFVEPTHDSGGQRCELVLSVNREGEVLSHRAPHLRHHERRRSLYGIDWHERLELSAVGLQAQIRFSPPVDDGPFYQRYLVEAETADGELGRGTAELLLPGRIDLEWQRWLVQMRCHRPSGDNSIWLPLFTGPRKGRVRRLLRTWISGARQPESQVTA